MSAGIKFCGLRRPDDVAEALRLGADYFGFILVPTSARHVSLQEARQLRGLLPPERRSVAVLVDPSDALLDDLVPLFAPHYLQLHGNETPARAAALRARYGLPVIKAVAVREAADVAGASAYAQAADLLLFDTRTADGRTGGTGQSFDWRMLAGFATPLPWFLSGGLHAGNVAEAVRTTGAALVDASSGIERAPGEKDHAKMAAFAAAVKALP